MENLKLKQLIQEYQRHDMSRFGEIYETFSRLICFYAGRIDDDDAKQDLTVFLVELLFKLDLSRFNDDGSEELRYYIAACIKHEYILLAKEAATRKARHCECDTAEEYTVPDNDRRIALTDGLALLNPKQRKVLILRYYCDYSDLEIAKLLNISRQAVCKLRNRGLDLLSIYLRDKNSD